MAITLTVADNADGTGAVATIAGSAGGTTNTVYAQLVDATGLRSPTFTSVGSRSGDGTVNLTLAPAYYWAHVSNLSGSTTTVSNMAYFAVTDATEAVLERCLDAVKARLEGLVMAGQLNARVYDQTVLNDKVVQYPAVILSLEQEVEQQPGILTGRDDIGYGIRLAVVDRIDADYTAKRATLLMWRQQIFRALRQQRLAGVTEVYQVKIEPGPVVDWNAAQGYQYHVSSMVVRCLSREIRG